MQALGAMHPRVLKDRLNADQVAVGALLADASPGMIDLLGLLKFHFVILDAEHGELDFASCVMLVRCADAAGIPAVIRVPNSRPDTVARALDLRVAAIQVPHIDGPEDAQALVRAAKYGPLGDRGVSATRALQYGLGADLADCMQAVNSNALVVAHVESVAALNNLNHLLAVHGIDVFVIGHNDLAQSMGFPGQADHPTVRAAVQQAIRDIRAAGRIAGAGAGSGASAREAIRAGARYIVSDLRRLLGKALAEYLAEVSRCE